MSTHLTPGIVPEDASLNRADLDRAILERGVFYYPAGLRYANPDAAVTCDRCRRTRILACIGFRRYDYCVPCVDAVARAQSSRTNSLTPPIMNNYMTQNSLPSQCMTHSLTPPMNNYMTQNSLPSQCMTQNSLSSQCMTLMVQDTVEIKN
jgi:hypothetical protein